MAIHGHVNQEVELPEQVLLLHLIAQTRHAPTPANGRRCHGKNGSLFEGFRLSTFPAHATAIAIPRQILTALKIAYIHPLNLRC